MLIVAELSANHGQSLTKAIELVEVAKTVGADAVKFQTFQPEEMVGNAGFVIESGSWAGRKLIDLYREAQTPREWHAALFERARKVGLIPFSTPFSRSDVDFLETMNCPIYKIASFEITDLSLIGYAASKGKPMIMSTGMATRDEIGAAVLSARTHQWHPDITLLQCVSAYPAPAHEANLLTMSALAGMFNVSVGLSDHTRGTAVAVAAAVMEAEVIEKHLTLSRADGGPDSGFSLEPDEFARMVADVRTARAAIGDVWMGPKPSEAASLALRRSLWWARDVKAGEIIQPEDLRTARPALGRPPADADQVIGKTASTNYYAGEPVL